VAITVLPDATLKVYLVAAPEVRASRRAAEMGSVGRYEEYLGEIQRRDAADTEREVAPLRQADGALVIDTGEHDVAAAVAIIRHRLGARHA
jgi:cytidylate kinase